MEQKAKACYTKGVQMEDKANIRMDFFVGCSRDMSML